MWKTEEIFSLRKRRILNSNDCVSKWDSILLLHLLEQNVLKRTLFYCFWATVTGNSTVCPMLRDWCPVLSVTLVYCVQTVGWIKMQLGVEVGLGSGDIMLDGDPAPLMERDTAAPTFRPMSFWPMSVVVKWLRRPSQLLCHACKEALSIAFSIHPTISFEWLQMTHPNPWWTLENGLWGRF